MGWLIFTAIDLYLGVVIIDVLARSESVSEEKRRHLSVVKKVTIFLLALTILALLVDFVRSKWV